MVTIVDTRNYSKEELKFIRHKLNKAEGNFELLTLHQGTNLPVVLVSHRIPDTKPSHRHLEEISL